MVVEITYLDKPRFALGQKLDPTQSHPFAPKRPGTEAAVLTISASGSAKGEQASRSKGPSVFAQLTSELSELTKRMSALDEKLENTASGTDAYTALTKERESLELEFQRITAPGESSPLTDLVTFLESATSGFTQPISGRAYDRAIALFGNDGAAFLRRGGAGAAQEIASALASIGADAAGISDPVTAASVNETLTRLDHLFTGEVFSEGAEEQTYAVEKGGKRGRPIELEQLNFVAAGQISLGLQSASPEDLMRAATSGIDISVVNHLLLKPESLDAKEEERKQAAGSGIIELSRDDTSIDESVPA